MPLKSIYLVPHGGAIVEDLEGPLKPDGILLNRAMKKVASEIRDDNIQLILLTSPHGYIHPTDYLIYFHDIYEEWQVIENNGQQHVKRNMWMGNVQVAQILYQLLRESGISASPLILGDTNFPLKLSWGDAIPLSFISGIEGPQSVIFSLPMYNGESNQDELKKLSKTILDMLNLDIFQEINVALVISGDLSHKHDPEHHYGFHEDAKVFDELAVQWSRSQDASIIAELYKMYDTAAPCGLQGMNIIQSIFDLDSDWKHENTVYGLPTYFGMQISSFKKK